MRRSMVLTMATILFAGVTARAGNEDLHDPFDALLDVYVTDTGVRYDAWAEASEDVQALSRYVDELEAASPSDLDEPAALAYWINLYNATTVELVLSHYPVDSIKDIGGFLRSPWNKKLVVVEGEKLSLNAIENEIIRERFADARIHFALNCASVGCPPLAREAYRGATLNDQLDAVCQRTLEDPRWVRIEDDRLLVSKIFDWYRGDFEAEAGSVIAFIARYRADVKTLVSADPDIEHLHYDWSLNRSR